MNAEIRKLFPALGQYAYLNSAAVAPMPLTALEAVNSQLRDVSEHGTLHFADWIAAKDRARQRVGRMLNVTPNQIAFMRNTSDGLSSIANGIDWAEGENIVSFAQEFPSNFYGWRRIRDTFGVDLRLCPERGGRIDLNELTGMIDANTRVVALSAVQYGSGFKANLERIGRAAREVDALFVVDIIQGLGAMPFDLPAQFVDAAAGASHKWLCAPEGCGFLYLSARAREKVVPTIVGWISVDDPWHFGDREQDWKSTALAWESGTGSSSLFYGLDASLALLEEAGAENIQKHLEGLTDYLCEELAGRDYEVISSRLRGEKSQIVCIRNKAGWSPNDVGTALERESVIVSVRGDRIRIAPHFFNNEADIDRLLAALP
jgi:cysteine desulfurase / selenocysteine lyase